MDKVEIIMRVVLVVDGNYAHMENHQVIVRSNNPTDDATSLSLVTLACCEVLEKLTGFDPYDSLHHYKKCVEPLTNPDHNC